MSESTSVYEQEVGYVAYSVTVSENKHPAARELRSFKVLSWRSGADVAEDSTNSSQSLTAASSMSDLSTEDVHVQDAPLSRKVSNVSYQQVVWRTLKDFRELHGLLVAYYGSDVLPVFPKAASWVSSVLRGAHAVADELQRSLDVYMKSLIAHPTTSMSRHLLSFLTPAERPDWPPAFGAIDLAVHDLPHDSSATEWWYINAHWRDIEGNEYSAFAAFFRVLKHTAAETGVKSYAHALNWALTDVAANKYIQECVLDRDSPEIVRKQLDTGKVIRDPRLLRAYRETLDRGAVPLPDRMFSPGRDAAVATDKLDLDFESATFTKDAAGRYRLVTRTPDGRTGADLTFTPRKAPVRHGLNGIVKGHDGDDMWYYFIPRCDVSGTFTVGGVVKEVAPGSGTGWYDHEFGGVPPEDGEVRLMQYAWTWAALQLDNGVDVSAAVLVDPRTTPQRLMETRAVVVGADGARAQPDDLSFSDVPTATWTSVRTFSRYPTAWNVKMPSAGIDLALEAVFADQEFMTLIARPGFWEGRVRVTGTIRGVPVSGVGYVERNGYTSLSELDGFFKAVGAETRRAVAEVYPAPGVMTHDDAVSLIASKDTAWYIDGVDVRVFAEGIVSPVRYITDMGGKSWRSYGALACIDVVGGDARNFVRWLSMPEFLHVGSLIIDDIEDGSLKRRGVDCAHIKFGEPIAINAGCAAYFQSHQLLLVPGLSDAQLNKIYGYYFAALRAGHAGQALDIAGLGYLMDDVIERGDAALAESRLIAIHRLKTAVPAASLARMGALVGGGTEAQIEAIGRYYESIGVAFQIMDDVLNLRGIYSGKADKMAQAMELKTLGEDITAGKVTMPVVKALAILPKDEMLAMWRVIQSKPHDRVIVSDVIARLEAVGAIDACIIHANDLVEDAYAALEPLIPDSFSKIMLRAFGWYVAEQSAPRVTRAELATSMASIRSRASVSPPVSP